MAYLRKSITPSPPFLGLICPLVWWEAPLFLGWWLCCFDEHSFLHSLPPYHSPGLYFHLSGHILRVYGLERYYFGDWLFPIKIKIVLSGVLFHTLVDCLPLWTQGGRRNKGGAGDLRPLPGHCDRSGLLWSPIVIRRKASNGLQGDISLSGRRKTIQCRLQGLPSSGADIASGPAVEQFDTFLAFLRNPNRPGGSPTGMPPFPPDQLSNEQALHLYHYIIILLSTQSSKAAAK